MSLLHLIPPGIIPTTWKTAITSDRRQVKRPVLMLTLGFIDYWSIAKVSKTPGIPFSVDATEALLDNGLLFLTLVP